MALLPFSERCAEDWQRGRELGDITESPEERVEDPTESPALRKAVWPVYLHLSDRTLGLLQARLGHTA